MTATLVGTAPSGTVHARLFSHRTQRVAYLPFGWSLAADQGCLGFAGQWQELRAGLYLPGNGYRGYSPALGRFLQPDGDSPFLQGGIQAYAYCAADPINRADYTGRSFTPLVIAGLVSGTAASALHVANLGSKSAKSTPTAMTTGIRLALLASLASVVSSVVAGTQPDNQQTQAALGWTSIGLGVVSAALRISVLVPGLRQAGVRKVAGRVTGWHTNAESRKQISLEGRLNALR
jgi:RHS repeat-associated protein